VKLIIAIVQDQDASGLIKTLVKNNIRATKLSTSGSFLKAGNTTFLIGVKDRDVDDVLEIIKVSSHRSQQLAQAADLGEGQVKVDVGGATIFVLDVEQFERF
jgi:uncharacterized protein YaaQ